MSSNNGDQERYQKYLCSREWGLLREAVRERCHGICERCRHSPMSHVHHLTYIRKYQERLEDLQGLCDGCHQFVHGKRDRDPMLDVPIRVEGEIVQQVYLAGKISKHGWREEILGFSPDGTADRVDLTHDDLWPTLPFWDGRLRYVGPYFMRCDHGCAHEKGAHAWTCDQPCASLTPADDVYDRCVKGLMKADLVFAWIDRPDCHGTILELGFFRGYRPEMPIVIAGPSMIRDLWLVYHVADRVIFGLDVRAAFTCMVERPHLLSSFKKWRDDTSDSNHADPLERGRCRSCGSDLALLGGQGWVGEFCRAHALENYCCVKCGSQMAHGQCDDCGYIMPDSPDEMDPVRA